MPTSFNKSTEKSLIFQGNSESVRGHKSFKRIQTNIKPGLLGMFFSLSSSINIPTLSLYPFEPSISTVLEERVITRITLKQAYNLALKSFHNHESTWHKYLKQEANYYFLDEE